MGKIEDSMPDWALPAFLVIAGFLLYQFNDAIGRLVTAPAPNYEPIGILSIIAGIFMFLRRRRYI